jgi:hypothetical protein
MTTDAHQVTAVTEQGNGPAADVADASPWMTVREAARYARRSYETVRRACVENQRTNGQYGLKCAQSRPGTKILIQRVDVMRWMNGRKPE